MSLEGSKQANELNVSLEDHLVASLRDVYPLVPEELRTTLRPYISQPKPSTIPYSVLLSTSRWSQGNGAETLRAQNPSLNPNEYSMIALLAGVKTSPERNFGNFTPPQDPHQAALDRKAERKAITALLNSILSVLGSGFAAWWAADKTGWKNEWKVLLGLLAAFIVAIAEALLYLIWMRSKEKSAQPKRRVKRQLTDKKNDGPEEEDIQDRDPTSTTTDDKGRLRRRK